MPDMQRLLQKTVEHIEVVLHIASDGRYCSA